jgi:predicted HD phosphohydrolase
MNSKDLDRGTIVPFLASIFERRGAEEYLGEPVTIAEHMLQGAALAEAEGASEELVAAALLHDIATSPWFGTSPDDVEDKAPTTTLEPLAPSSRRSSPNASVCRAALPCARPDLFRRASPRPTLSLQGA